MLRILFAISSLLLFNSCLATTVLSVPLDRMAQSAEVIFYGRVLSNEVKLDPLSQRVATFTTFEVIDSIKGVNADHFILKQVGGQLPGSALQIRVQGVPRFTENEEYVVFLPQPSRLGFASPIGLSQGSYLVGNSASGKTVSNRRSVLISTQQRNPASTSTGTALEDFLQNVRRLSGQ